MTYRFRLPTAAAAFPGGDLDLATTTVSPEGCETPEAIADLVAELTVRTPLAEELSLAIVGGEQPDEHPDARPDARPDGTRFALALLGALAYAGRAGCRPVQVRRFADAFVRTTLEAEAAPAAIIEDSAARALRAVDTLYLLHGARAFAGDARMLADVALMLEGDDSVN